MLPASEPRKAAVAPMRGELLKSNSLPTWTIVALAPKYPPYFMTDALQVFPTEP